MAKSKIHWYRGCGFGKRSSQSMPYTPALFVQQKSINPDWYCWDCAKAARLALAKESAPKPADVAWPKPRPIVEADRNTRYLCWFPSIREWMPCYPLNVLYRGSAVHCATHFLPLPPSPEVK